MHGFERVLRERLEQLEVRDRRARPDAVDGPPRAVDGIATDRRLDATGDALRSAMHQRYVFALDLATAHHPLQRVERLLVARDDEKPRGLLVETVHDPRAILFSTPRQSARGEHARERWSRRARRRMRHEPDRLVDNDEVLILIEDLRFEHLRDFQLDLLDLRLVDRDDLTALDARAAGLDLAVDQHVTVVDEPLRSRAREA